MMGNKLLLLIITTSLVISLKADEPFDNFHWVPQAGGQWEYVSIDELNSVAVDQELRFNAEKDIVYYLFTNTNKGIPEKIIYRDENSLKASTFNNKNPTKFLIHGWQSDYKAPVISEMAKAFLKKGNFNCIGVDWSKISGTIDYGRAKVIATQNGPVVAKMIDFLVERGQKMNQISCLGHSLGAQTCGIVGKKTSKGKLHTIIGMDPAGPLFFDFVPSERITPTDAEYVEVVHTNGGKLGYYEPIGQSDFYPNGGGSQNGCGVDLSGACSHGRSVELVIESILTGRLKGTQCKSFADAKKGKCSSTGPFLYLGGEPSNHNKKERGIFYMQTRSQKPFALN